MNPTAVDVASVFVHRTKMGTGVQDRHLLLPVAIRPYAFAADDAGDPRRLRRQPPRHDPGYHGTQIDAYRQSRAPN